MLQCDTRAWCFSCRVRSPLTASSLSTSCASMGDGRGTKLWWCNCCCRLLAWQSGQVVGLTWSAAWRWRRQRPGAVWAPGWKGITARAALPRWVMPMGWMGCLGRRATCFDRLCGGGDVRASYHGLGDMRAASAFEIGVCWRRPHDLPGESHSRVKCPPPSWKEVCETLDVCTHRHLPFGRWFVGVGLAAPLAAGATVREY
jgi:hypothetical protein